MPTNFDLSPENVLALVRSGQPVIHEPVHHANTTNIAENGGMSFEQYETEIGAREGKAKYESEFDKLLSKHRQMKDPSKFERKVTNHAFNRKYGEFSHEVERMINDGLLQRK